MPSHSPTPARPLPRSAALLSSAESLLAAELRRYRLIDRIATGSMGVVYRAVDRRLARTVALKLLRTDVSHRTEVQRNAAIARARFLQEARAMAQLAHPNVVPIYAIESVGPHLVIAMEYVPGMTLAQWLGERRSWTEVLAVMRAAGEGLAAAHDAGFVHRDFKPHNVLIGDDGRVRVTDFGLAMLQSDDHDTQDERCGPAPDATIDDGVLPIDVELEPFESLTQTGMSVGTPAYMAPEQHAGGIVDARTDQYGFCAALYEALYGVRPFIGCDAVELMRAKRGMRLIAPLTRRAVPRWLERAVLRGLSPDASRRFPSMRALLAALTPTAKRRWLAGVSTGLAAAGFAAGLALSLSTPAAAASDSPELGRPRVELARAGARAPIVRAQRLIAAHDWAEAERTLGAAYFAAIADAQFADAAASADLLALVAFRTNDTQMADHWHGHAAAARARR